MQLQFSPPTKLRMGWGKRPFASPRPRPAKKKEREGRKRKKRRAKRDQKRGRRKKGEKNFDAVFE